MNGSALGSHLKGYFDTTELGAVKLFVDTRIPPFIYFQSNGNTIIFNLEDARKTAGYYDSMLIRLEVD
jgi:hypothetical protein